MKLNKTMQIKMPDSLFDKVNAIANKDMLTASTWVRMIISQKVKELEDKQYALDQEKTK